jgi:hypothetical protein
MGFYKTNVCFFTNQEVLRNNENDGTFIDGYYYVISINGKERELRLSWSTNWANNEWVQEHGGYFIELLEEKKQWDFFKTGKTLQAVKEFYRDLKNL